MIVLTRAWVPSTTAMRDQSDLPASGRRICFLGGVKEFRAPQVRFVLVGARLLGTTLCLDNAPVCNHGCTFCYASVQTIRMYTSAGKSRRVCVPRLLGAESSMCRANSPPADRGTTRNAEAKHSRKASPTPSACLDAKNACLDASGCPKTLGGSPIRDHPPMSRNGGACLDAKIRV